MTGAVVSKDSAANRELNPLPSPQQPALEPSSMGGRGTEETDLGNIETLRDEHREELIRLGVGS